MHLADRQALAELAGSAEDAVRTIRETARQGRRRHRSPEVGVVADTDRPVLTGVAGEQARKAVEAVLRATKALPVRITGMALRAGSGHRKLPQMVCQHPVEVAAHAGESAVTETARSVTALQAIELPLIQALAESLTTPLSPQHLQELERVDWVLTPRRRHRGSYHTNLPGCAEHP